MQTVFFTQWRKQKNINQKMIVGLFIKEEFMILQNMQKFILEEERYFQEKEKIVQNYTKNIILGLVANI